jgi:hypothetical protein
MFVPQSSLSVDGGAGSDTTSAFGTSAEHRSSAQLNQGVNHVGKEQGIQRFFGK